MYALGFKKCYLCYLCPDATGLKFIAENVARVLSVQDQLKRRPGDQKPDQ